MQKLLIILSIYAIAYIYIFAWENKPQFMKDSTDLCLVNSGKNYTFRGNNYFLGDRKKEINLGNCFVTTWNLLHLLFNAVLTYIAPEYWAGILLTGVAFELYEMFVYSCHDLFDIPMNVLGIMIGLALKQWGPKF